MPFPYAVPNPAMQDVVGPMWDWIREFDLIRDDDAAVRLRRTRPELTTALYFPTADPEQLAAISQFMAWAFLADDEFDDGPMGQDPALTEPAVLRLLRVLDWNTPFPQVPLEAALADSWRRIAVGRSAGWQRAFAADVRSWLQTYPAEARDRANSRLPGVAEYITHRRDGVGELMFMDLCEPAAGIDIAEDLRALPAMVEMRNAIAEYVGLLNDIHSFRKEEPLGYAHNMIRILQHAENWTLQQAFDRTGELTTERINVFLAAEQDLDRQLTTTGADDAAGLQVSRCVAGYRSIIRGNYDYHLMAERYTLAAA
jgi:(+)-beta-caryophyllene/(+)-caryolan-1-ol synthase